MAARIMSAESASMSGISSTLCACAVAVTVASSVNAIERGVPSSCSVNHLGWMASNQSGLATNAAVPAAAVSAPIQPQCEWPACARVPEAAGADAPVVGEGDGRSGE